METRSLFASRRTLLFPVAERIATTVVTGGNVTIYPNRAPTSHLMSPCEQMAMMHLGSCRSRKKPMGLIASQYVLGVGAQRDGVCGAAWIKGAAGGHRQRAYRAGVDILGAGIVYNSLPLPLPFPLEHHAYIHPIGMAVPVALQGLAKTLAVLKKEASLPDKPPDPGYR